MCISNKKHMVTASYVSPAMQQLDAQARKAGVLLLNEMGVDPGIDHMSALKMIADARQEGSEIVGFASLCGGLPAPEAATNRLGYKFSWSPKGVLTASKNPASFLVNEKVIKVQPQDLLKSSRPLDINPAFNFELLPNRDSLSYAELYGIPNVKTMFRGTIRYAGFCRLLGALADWGYLAEKGKSAKGVSSAREYTTAICGSKLKDRPDVAELLQEVGLLKSAPLPGSARTATSPIDVLAGSLSTCEAMKYKDGERDMIVMHHELLVKQKDGSHCRKTATMFEYGNERGTAMARTVGITTAIGAQMILDKVIPASLTGV